MSISPRWWYTRQWLHTLNPVLLLDLHGSVQGLSITVVPDGDISSGFRQRLSDTKTYSCARTRDNGGPPLQREQRQDFGFRGGSRIVVVEMTPVHRSVRHLNDNVARRVEAMATDRKSKLSRTTCFTRLRSLVR